jgi:imidazolonepropionase-like amidohydrolase
MNRCHASLVGACLVFGILGTAMAEDVVAIKAGRIIPMSGDEIRDGVILVNNGRIEALGKDLEIPWDARVIDASDRVVMPGLFEAHSSQGLDRANENAPSVPFVSVYESVDPLSPYFADSLREGVTSILLIPGNSTLIGGKGMIVKPVGPTVEDMTVKLDVALKMSLRPMGGRSRMAHIAELRKTLRGIQEAMKKDDKPLDDKRKALGSLLEGTLPGVIYCENASDVMRGIALAKEFGIKMIPVLGRDGYKAADLLAKAGLPAVVDPTQLVWERDGETGVEVPHATPKVLADAGVKFALQVQSSTLGGRYLWYQAATAVRHGLPRDDALRAITLWPAEILGVADRVGSLEKGKDANLLVLTGDPLDVRTWVDVVMIEGEVVYERSKDETLKKVGGGK